MKKLLQQDDKNDSGVDDGGGGGGGGGRFLFSQNLHFKSKERETRLLKITIVGI